MAACEKMLSRRLSLSLHTGRLLLVVTLQGCVQFIADLPREGREEGGEGKR